MCKYVQVIMLEKCIWLCAKFSCKFINWGIKNGNAFPNSWKAENCPTWSPRRLIMQFWKRDIFMYNWDYVQQSSDKSKQSHTWNELLHSGTSKTVFDWGKRHLLWQEGMQFWKWNKSHMIKWHGILPSICFNSLGTGTDLISSKRQKDIYVC